MARRVRPLLSAVLVAAGVAGSVALLAPAAAAAAQPIGECTTSSGVVLAVDFGHWGGPLLRACGTTPTTGYTLVNQGGWHTTGTVHDGPAFVCRIGYDGYQGGTRYPTANQDPCVATPPASAYWSYWHADPGQHTWSYSQLGAMSYRPEAGSVELWTFGATNVSGSHGMPTISPDAVRATNTQPVGKPTTPPSPKPAPAHTTPAPAGTTATSSTPAAGSGGGSVPAPTGAAAGGTTASTAPSGTLTPSSSATGAAGATDGLPSAGPSVVDAAPLSASAAQEPAGSPLPLLLGLAVVALVALLALAARWRRRSQSS